LFYTPFDAWWYLRFLLPMWPVLLLLTVVGISGIACRVFRRAEGARGWVVAAIVVALTAYGLRVAVERRVFDLADGQRRYAEVGRFLVHLTEPNAVILSWQHSGSIRLYADRLTLRFDILDPAWLDRAIEYLQAAGRHPYIVIEEFEEPKFRKRFESVSRIGALDWQPVAEFESPRLAIYDAIERANQHAPLVLGARAGSGRCGGANPLRSGRRAFE
jgi:hypothetical protein